MYLLFQFGTIGKIPNPGPPFQVHSQLWFTILVIWVIPYILCANGLFLYAYFKSKNSKIKQEALQTFIMVAPPTIAGMCVNYTSAALGLINLLRYEIWMFLYVFVTFMIFALKDSALGAKIRIEKYQVHNTIRAMSSGTAVLNHAIKNEVNNINICLYNLQSEIDQDNSNAVKSLEFIQKSTTYLITMVNRIQEHFHDVSLEKDNININDLVEQSLQQVQSFLTEKQIRVHQGFR